MTSGALRLLILFWRASYPGTRRWNPNFNQYLNREPWFATLHILNSVGVGVNPVFCDLKVRLCKPVPCPFVQGMGTISGNQRMRTETRQRPSRGLASYTVWTKHLRVLEKPNEAGMQEREFHCEAHLRAR